MNWIKSEDKLPPSGRWVMMWHKEYKSSFCGYIHWEGEYGKPKKYSWYHHTCDDEEQTYWPLDQITYWQPKPCPPEGEIDAWDCDVVEEWHDNWDYLEEEDDGK